MKKKYYLFVSFWCFIICGVFAQDQKLADSFSRIYMQPNLNDTVKLELLRNLSFNEVRNYNLGVKYAEELISLSQRLEKDNYLRTGYFIKGTKERLLGNLDEALQSFFKSAEVAKKSHNRKGEGDAYGAIADIYSVANNHPNAKHYYNKAITTLRQSDNSINLAAALLNAGDELRKIKGYDSALIYFREAQMIFENANDSTGKAYSLGNIGMVYANIGKHADAEKNLREAISILEKLQNYDPICVYLLSMADVYLYKGDKIKAMTFTAKSLRLAEQFGLKEQIRDASLKMAELSENQGNSKVALKHYKNYVAYRDSLNNLDAERSMANQRYNYEMSQKQIEVNAINAARQNERKLNTSLFIILGLTIFILAILFNYNRNKQKAYKILNLQKQETEAQKAKAEDALIELQVTQKQLIQSAKMASLGELTAGIAHEIQNPLNFVNNFAELSVELLNELKEGAMNKLTASDKSEADKLIYDLVENLRKINEHGKRADSIVKGMLQHARTSTGKKEPTDINALADQSLRLSYHGFKAKNKDFNTKFTADFDESIGEMNIISQDIGRVLLNLCNNAFYAVNEKKKQENSAYEPLVSITTKRVDNKVELSVKDNGIGIPKMILDKIFQPFFTTKPTGQGTGLGLSLSYDIIIAHGGEFKIETEEGKFTKFIIQLPMGNNNLS